MDYHLAQLNVAKAIAPMDDPLMADFVAQLDHVNALAESSPGFVWRLQDETGDATSIQAFNDPLLLINMSVWESVESLRNFVYRNMEHQQVMGDRRRWFTPMDGPHMALWWIPAGHIPTLSEARQKLDLLTERGPTADVFTFGRRFDPAQSAPSPDKP